MRDDLRDDSIVRDLNPNPGKRPYHAPKLTEYGSVEELIDGGVMGLLALIS